MPPRKAATASPQPRPVGRKPSPAPATDNGYALSERQIVQAARQLIVEAGVDGLSMRALSAKLGVALGATYHHVPNKRDLLVLVARDLYDEVVLPDRGTWDQRLKKLMVSVADVVGRHPGMASFMNANVADTMPVELNRRVTELLSEAGFSPRNVQAVMGALFIYVNGVSSAGIGGTINRVDINRMFLDGLDMLLVGARASLEEDLIARRRRGRRPS
jgi:AcrR family transcriptional regulator